MVRWFLVVFAVWVVCGDARAFGDSLPNPFPSQAQPTGTPTIWRFPESMPDWRLQRDCEVQSDSADHTTLRLTGGDPILERSVASDNQLVILELVCRTDSSVTGQFFWDQTGTRHFTEKQSQRFELHGDNQWHTYRVVVPESGIRALRWDPVDALGTLDVQEIRMQPYELPPIEIERLDWIDSQRLKVRLRNSTDGEVTTKVHWLIGNSNEQTATIEVAIPGAATREIELLATPSSSAADVVTIVAESTQVLATADQQNFPQTSRVQRSSIRIGAFDRSLNSQAWDEAFSGWLNLVSEDRSIWFSPDGTAAVLGTRSAETDPWRWVAWIAPLVWDRSRIQPMRLQKDGLHVEAKSELATARFQWTEQGLSIDLQSEHLVEGPVIHVPGEIEQGLLAGVEYLGRGESSSSNIDINTGDRFRYEPPPHHLTMQLASIVTSADSVSLQWDDPTCQPVFATPNFYDGTSDSRMGLRGQNIRAMLRITRGWDEGNRIEDAILDYVQSRSLPSLSPTARADAEQADLDYAGLTRSELFVADSGWYHAILPRTSGMPAQPRWFGDHASALLALQRPLPVDASKLVRGGSHLENNRWMFLSGRANEWAESKMRELEGLLARQQPDGSVVYDGPWAEGHFEPTSSGQCGIVAERLMKIAWQTGNEQALAAGLKTLKYCEKFRTPRGAQVWECPLHAPDIMASAHLARAYALVYRMTGDALHLQRATRWAISGLPFVYQWGTTPQMPYATIATLCATHRVAPLWIGRPVQWCGLVYADALLDLAEVDQTLDWKHIAAGIHRSATHQQYVEGPSIGLLPDSVFPQTGRRFPYDINPATIVQVGQRLAGRPVELCCQVVDGHHIVSPWAMELSETELRFKSESAEPFQIAIDGEVRTVQPNQVFQRPVQ